MLRFFLPLAFPLIPVSVADAEIAQHPAPAPLVACDHSSQTSNTEPELWLSLPSSGEALTPVLPFGMNFADAGFNPYFGFTPSIPIFQFGVELPFIGKPSFMLTTAPPSIFSGEVNLYLKRGLFGRESNRLTWTYL